MLRILDGLIASNPNPIAGSFNVIAICKETYRAIAVDCSQTTQKYRLLRLEQYTDGKPCWRTVSELSPADLQLLDKHCHRGNAPLGDDFVMDIQDEMLERLLSKDYRLWLVSFVVSGGLCPFKTSALTPFGTCPRSGNIWYTTRCQYIGKALSLYHFIVKGKDREEVKGELLCNSNLDSSVSEYVCIKIESQDAGAALCNISVIPGLSTEIKSEMTLAINRMMKA